MLTTYKTLCYLDTGDMMVNEKEIVLPSRIIKSRKKGNKPIISQKLLKLLKYSLTGATKEKYRML